MADENEITASAAPSGASAADAVAFTGASQAKADSYLEEHTRFVKLQSTNLLEQNEFEVSHLRFRRFSDYARAALEVAAGLVVLLIICGLGTMVWSASQDQDLVVEAFSVPPDMVQTGLTGSVLANRILDRFGDMDRNVLSYTADFSGYHGAKSEEVRVEIPDTGVSIGELNRYLRAWLGHETHVTGELVRTGDKFSLTVRYGDNPGATVEGPASDLDKLIRKSAENMFLAANPLRFADYLSSHGRVAEAREIAERETHTGSDEHKSQAYVSLGASDYWSGNARDLERVGPVAVRLDPKSVVAWYLLISGPNNTDREEELLRDLNAGLPHMKAADARAANSEQGRAITIGLEAEVQQLKGDWQSALDVCKTGPGDGRVGCNRENRSDVFAALHEEAKADTLLADLSLSRVNGSVNIDLMNAYAQNAVAVGNWQQALLWSKKAEDAVAKDSTQLGAEIVFLRPFEAEALARTGDVIRARTMIAATPPDCDFCVRARGRINSAAGNWSAAAYWFAIVSRRTPSIPFADADWGAMLLAKGDLDGAIAKFESAHEKGPRFADPLEMWGEALIRENHSDLALTKFSEAAKYAPNWGRLHLKWGEALLWTGDKIGAAKEFGIAGRLELTAAEKAELARVSHV